jgi:hypothetical protein
VFLIQPSVIALATIIAGPAIYGAFVSHDVTITAMLGRYVLAIALSAVLMSMLRGLTASYRGHRRNPPASGGGEAEDS